MKLGVSYIPPYLAEHIETDIKHLASIGMDEICFALQENHFVYLKGAVDEGAKIAADNGLWPSIVVWGFANTFGGGRMSKILLQEPDLMRRDKKGGPVGQACLNNPGLVTRFCEYIEVAAQKGFKGVIIDEPKKQQCFCGHCRKAFGGDLETSEGSAEYERFRIETIRRYCRQICTAVKLIDPSLVTMNVMMPAESDFWESVADCEDLDVFGTDPYWLVPHPDCNYSIEQAIQYSLEMKELCQKLGKQSQLWLGAWWIPGGKEEELYRGGKKLAALECDQFYNWSFRAGKGTSETSEDPDKTWAAIERLYRELSGK